MLNKLLYTTVVLCFLYDRANSHSHPRGAEQPLPHNVQWLEARDPDTSELVFNYYIFEGRYHKNPCEIVGNTVDKFTGHWDYLNGNGGGRRLNPADLLGLWPGGVVPFDFSSYPASHRTTLENLFDTQAVPDYASKTAVQLIKRNGHSDYVSFVNGSGCSSAIGRQGGRQEIVLNTNGCLWKNILIHEIGHALGMFHTQSRTDRGNFVKVNWENIEEDKDHNFEIESGPFIFLCGCYDCSSIMHYTEFAFNGPPPGSSPTAVKTLESINPTCVIDPGDELTGNDANCLNGLYGGGTLACNTNSPTRPPTRRPTLRPTPRPTPKPTPRPTTPTSAPTPTACPIAMPNRCGTSWFETETECNGECCTTDCSTPGEICYGGLTCAIEGTTDPGPGPGPSPAPCPTALPYRCGYNWVQTNTDCNGECCISDCSDPHQTCYAGLSCGVIAPPPTDPPTNPPESCDGKPYRCGTSWFHADLTCGQCCFDNTHCPVGESCFNSLQPCSADPDPVLTCPVGKPYHCGASWADANDKCTDCCFDASDCPNGEGCWANVCGN